MSANLGEQEVYRSSILSINNLAANLMKLFPNLSKSGYTAIGTGEWGERGGVKFVRDWGYVMYFILGALTNILTGKVLDNGTIDGDVIMSGDNISDFTRGLDENFVGEGIYQTNIPTSGTWVAVKK
ncbi:MAG: hypothetical protein AB8B69_18170 [Chitinophagales bacterium]